MTLEHRLTKKTTTSICQIRLVLGNKNVVEKKAPLVSRDVDYICRKVHNKMVVSCHNFSVIFLW